MFTCLSKPFGFELGITLKVVIMMLSTMAFGLLAVTWIQCMEKYYDNIIPDSVTRELTFQDIEYIIRKEGYIPFLKNEKYITFKASGEECRVFYKDDMLSLRATYLIDNDVNLDLVLKTCSIAQEQGFCFRSYLQNCPNGETVLTFEIETLVHLVNEFERFFPNYLKALLHAIEIHRVIYVSLSEEKSQEKVNKYINPLS